MHPEVINFVRGVKKTYPAFFANTKVLEVGSRNVNGTIRDEFTRCDYMGIDLVEGPGVDRVCHAGDMDGEDKTFDVVVSTEAMEHDGDWPRSLWRMFLCLKPGGLFLLTCAGPARAEHGTTLHHPEDSPATLEHYENLTTGGVAEVLERRLFSDYRLTYRRGRADLTFYGVKRGQLP